MKTLLVATIALLLTGCAGPSGQQFMQHFGEGLQQQAQQQQQRKPFTPIATKQTDNQCFQGCLSAGFQYGLCQNKCSY